MNRFAYAFVSLLVILSVGGTVSYFTYKEIFIVQRVALEKPQNHLLEVTQQWPNTIRTRTTAVPKAELSGEIFEADSSSFSDESEVESAGA